MFSSKALKLFLKFAVELEVRKDFNNELDGEDQIQIFITN